MIKSCIIYGFLLAILIGIGLAQNVKIDDVEAFRKALEQDGFTVQEGKIGYSDFIKLYDIGALPSAYGNNPATKYLSYFVPPAPNYKADKLLSEFSRMLGMPTSLTGVWNLRPDEPLFSWEEHHRSADTLVMISI